MRKADKVEPPASVTSRAEALFEKLEGTAGAIRARLAEKRASDGNSAQDGSPKPSANDAVERAEETVERIGQQLGGYIAVAGKSIRTAAAYAQEEAEDIFAEAQDLRSRSGR